MRGACLANPINFKAYREACSAAQVGFFSQWLNHLKKVISMDNKNSTKTIQDVLEPARFSRKRFLQLSAATAGLAVFGGTASGCAQPRGRNLRFASLDDALTEIDLIEENPPVEMQQEWGLAKVLNHLAQSAEYSMTGYPQLDSPIEQSIKRIAFNVFKSQGYMVHDLSMPVPGAPDIPEGLDLAEGFLRLRNAISDFQNYNGPLFPHFSYGELSYENWEIAHSMHIADHFSSLTYEIAGE